jgi:hypothetical protein
MHYCRKYKPADILEIPDVKESVHLFLGHGEFAGSQTRMNAKLQGNVVHLDHEEKIYACNCFMIYSLYPKQSFSI